MLGLQLVVEPAEHRRRIAARARAQFDAGLVEEARALRERWDPGLPAFSAIGYRESWAMLDGELTLEAAIELDAPRNVPFAQAPAHLVPARAGARGRGRDRRIPARPLVEPVDAVR